MFPAWPLCVLCLVPDVTDGAEIQLVLETPQPDGKYIRLLSVSCFMVFFNLLSPLSEKVGVLPQIPVSDHHYNSPSY